MEPRTHLQRARLVDTDNWDPERVRAALRGHAAAPLSGADAAAALADRALFLLGRGHAGVEAEFAGFYPVYAAQTAPAARRGLFERIRAHARSGLLRSDVLVHFLRLESDAEVVAETAFDVARLGVAAAGGAPRGADYVLELVVTGATANAGAALGGLLALASDEVNRKLALLRPALARPEADEALSQMARCARTPVHVASVAFWLDWMEALAPDLPAAQRAFDRAADALVAHRGAVRAAFVLEGSWVDGLGEAAALAPPGARELPLGRLCAQVAPRLAALAAAAPGSDSLRRAREAWAVVH
jgi:hypothetical protein